MAFGKNVLTTDFQKFTLNGCTVVNGNLVLPAQSFATYTLPKEVIQKLSSNIKLSAIFNEYSNPYNINVFITLRVIYTNNDTSEFNCTPTSITGDAYNTMIDLGSQAIETVTIKIWVKKPVTLTLLEIYPEEAAVDTETIMNSVNKALTKVLYDFNEDVVSVKQTEKTIANISCLLLQKVTVQGHLEIECDASQYCQLHLRVKDNGSTEPFAPLVFTLQAGRNQISVPHSYLDCAATVHSFIVAAQITNGTLSIATRKLLYSIDAGYLAERLIDIGADVRDLSICQANVSTGTKVIWLVGIEDNEVFVRTRDYEVSSVTTAWEPKYSLGTWIDAAIEFNGDFILVQDKYTIQTETEPYIFLRDNTNKLFVQKGNDETTRIQLDTDVTNMSVCRGFKSSLYATYDQGLICAYVKNGLAYYRNYCFNETANAYVWNPATIIDDTLTEVTHLSVQRLNDYRVGISVSTTTCNKLYISDRTYVNQGIPPETVAVNPSISTLIAAYSSSYVFNGVPIVFEDEFAPQRVFTITYEHDIITRSISVQLKDLFSAVINGIAVAIESVVLNPENTKQFIITLVNEAKYTSTGDSTIVINFNGGQSWWSIMFALPNGHKRLMDAGSWSWLIKRPTYYTYVTLDDQIYINPGAVANIAYHQLQTISNNPEDNVQIDVMVNPTLAYNALETINNNAEDTIQCNINVVSTIVLTALSTNPV